jgi:hypothetical protein
MSHDTRVPRKRSRFVQRLTVATSQGMRRDCSQKARHPSRKVAEGVLRGVIEQKGVLVTRTLTTYKCDLCHGWHLGNRRRGTFVAE